MLDHPIEPSILDAIEQGRGERGGKSLEDWSRLHAQVLTAAQRGLRRIRIAGAFGLSEGHVIKLISEACEAVLRGGAASEAADSVCAARWRSWCETGDTDACDRLRRS